MLIKKNKIGWVIVVVLSLLPVWLWYLAPTSIPRFLDAQNTLANLGQLAGLIGASMFALNLVLAARFSFLEKYFNGLNRMYDWHRWFGQIAFMLLLIHPLLLLPKYTFGSAVFAARFLLPLNSTAQNFGWWSLFLMTILIILTLYLRPKYNIWKLTHKFFGLAFLLGGIHVFLIPNDTYIDLPLRVYMLSLVAIGLAAFAYRSLFSAWLVKKYDYTVAAVRELNNQIIEVTIMPRGAVMKYEPGQFIFVSFKNKFLDSEIHPFSITSASDNHNITINIKKLGDYTSYLDKLQVGDIAEIEGPFGIFDYKRGIYQKQIWLAGGIGITPFLSMARSLSADDGYKIDLYYCVQNESELVYLSELQKMSPYLTVIPYISSQQGYITADTIQELSGSLDQTSIYVCAPLGMIDSLTKQLRLKGVSSHFIHSEEFNLD